MKIVNNQYENRHINQVSNAHRMNSCCANNKTTKFYFSRFVRMFHACICIEKYSISFNLFHNWYVVLFVLPENLVTILQQSTQLSITIIKKCAPSPIKLTGIDRPILLIIRSLYTDYVSLSILFFFAYTDIFSSPSQNVSSTFHGHRVKVLWTRCKQGPVHHINREFR